MSCYNDAVEVVVYEPKYKVLWDNFVSNSKNGVFLFYRDYMEYHADRFQDHSLLFFQKGKLVGLLPANVQDNVLYSHAGLTFGGIISSCEMKTSVMMQIFDKIIKYCKKIGVREVVYKTVPYIYHSCPAEEDLYALFRNNAQLIARNLSSCIYLPGKKKFSRNRLRTINIAKQNSIVVKRSFDLKTFMELAREVVKTRHGVEPVHTYKELELLVDKFPNNIQLFTSYKDDVMLSGVIMYLSKNVAHAQYGANSDAGWAFGAEDAILDYLINDYYKDKKYFDFGISTENCGQVLNVGLLHYKENYGASPVAYDYYRLLVS